MRPNLFSLLHSPNDSGLNYLAHLAASATPKGFEDRLRCSLHPHLRPTQRLKLVKFTSTAGGLLADVLLPLQFATASIEILNTTSYLRNTRELSNTVPETFTIRCERPKNLLRHTLQETLLAVLGVCGSGRTTEIVVTQGCHPICQA